MFRQDFINKLVFEQNISRINETIEIKLGKCVTRDEFIPIKSQLETFEKTLF